MVAVQAVIMFGSETWVRITLLEKTLNSFHHRVVWKMADTGPKHQQDRTWVCPPFGADLATVGLNEIGVYIALRQNTIAQYITNRPIMDLCLAEEQKPGMQISRRWWEQHAMYILGMRAGHAEVKGVEFLTQIRG